MSSPKILAMFPRLISSTMRTNRSSGRFGRGFGDALEQAFVHLVPQPQPALVEHRAGFPSTKSS